MHRVLRCRFEGVECGRNGCAQKGFPPYVPQDVMFQFMGHLKSRQHVLEILLRVCLWGARLGLGTHPVTNMVCKDRF